MTEEEKDILEEPEIEPDIDELKKRVEDLEHERSTWGGRTTSVQAKLDKARENLAQYGATLDDDSNIITNQPSQNGSYSTTGRYTPPVHTPDSEEEDFDPFDKVQVDKRAIASVAPAFAGVMQSQDWLIEQELKRQYPDWAEVQTEVKTFMNRLGAQGYAQLISLGASDLIETAVNASRGKRAHAAQQTEAAEKIRQEAAALAASAGGGSAAGGEKDYEFGDSEKEEIARLGLTLEEADALISGPATLDRKEKK